MIKLYHGNYNKNKLHTNYKHKVPVNSWPRYTYTVLCTLYGYISITVNCSSYISASPLILPSFTATSFLRKIKSEPYLFFKNSCNRNINVIFLYICLSLQPSYIPYTATIPHFSLTLQFTFRISSQTIHTTRIFCKLLHN